jgi:hypothetical protein
MVSGHCERLPDEGDFIQIPSNLRSHPEVIRELYDFIPNLTAINITEDYHGWTGLDLEYTNEDGTRKAYAIENSYIIKRSSNDWTIYPEDTFKKMYKISGGNSFVGW